MFAKRIIRFFFEKKYLNLNIPGIKILDGFSVFKAY